MNELETITDDVIEAAASILAIGNSRHKVITERRHRPATSTVNVEAPAGFRWRGSQKSAPARTWERAHRRPERQCCLLVALVGGCRAHGA